MKRRSERKELGEYNGEEVKKKRRKKKIERGPDVFIDKGPSFIESEKNRRA